MSASAANKESLEFEKGEPDVIEKRKPNAVFTYGRFNPPTIGHKKVIQSVIDEAEHNDADPYVVVSHSLDNKKNPLSYGEKITLIRKMFPSGVRVLHTSKEEPYIGKIIYRLKDAGYEEITMLVGSDRVGDFEKSLGSHAYLTIKSAGKRDPDSSNISGISATKIREAALEDRIENVKKGVNNAINADYLARIIQQRIPYKSGKKSTVKRKAAKKNNNNGNSNSNNKGLTVKRTRYGRLTKSKK